MIRMIRMTSLYSKMTNRTNGISLNVRYSVIIPPLDGYGLQCNSSQMSWKQLLVDLSNIYWNKGVIFSLDTGIFACWSISVIRAVSFREELWITLVCFKGMLQKHMSTLPQPHGWSTVSWCLEGMQKMGGGKRPHLWVCIRQLTCKAKWWWHKGVVIKLFWHSQIDDAYRT